MSKDQDVRPQSFDDYVGQRDTIAVLRRAVVAARHNGRACGHLLFAGQPGCGKTSLAQIIAAEMGTKLLSTVCPAIEHRGELTALLTSLTPRDVLFLDEIHGLKPAMQELLYTAMEDGVVDLAAGKKMIRLPLQPFTLVGATTRAHLLTGPLRDRFAYTFNLGHYSAEDLTTIAQRGAGRIGLSMDAHAAAVVGRCSRGTPRVALRLVRACRDMSQAAGMSHVDTEAASHALDMLGIDSLGLTASDRDYLGVLCERIGVPVGVTTLAAQLGLERGVIEGVIEPWLMEAGLIQRTPQGRIALPAAVIHLQGNPKHMHVTELAASDIEELS